MDLAAPGPPGRGHIASVPLHRSISPSTASSGPPCCSGAMVLSFKAEGQSPSGWTWFTRHLLRRSGLWAVVSAAAVKVGAQRLLTLWVHPWGCECQGLWKRCISLSGGHTRLVGARCGLPPALLPACTMLLRWQCPSSRWLLPPRTDLLLGLRGGKTAGAWIPGSALGPLHTGLRGPCIPTCLHKCD